MNRSKKMSTTMKLVPASIVGVLVVAALAILGMLDFDFGLPTGETESAASSEAEDGSEVMVKIADAPTGSAESVQQELRELEPVRPAETVSSDVAVQPTEMIDVVIDGDMYWVGTVRRGGQPVREPLTIDEVVGLAELMSGDPSGVKVRISRTFDATAQADTALFEQLKEAGLSEDEIDRRRTLVELE